MAIVQGAVSEAVSCHPGGTLFVAEYTAASGASDPGTPYHRLQPGASISGRRTVPDSEYRMAQHHSRRILCSGAVRSLRALPLLLPLVNAYTVKCLYILLYKYDF